MLDGSVQVLKPCVEGRGRDREGGGSAEGFQRGDDFWFPFLSTLVGQTGVSGANPV
jgi:hypothetical protein